MKSRSGSTSPVEPAPIREGAVLRAEGISMMFRARGTSRVGESKSWLQALRAVNLNVKRGETLAIVGESGCGKTTLGRILAQLLQPSDGHLYLDDVDVTQASGRELRSFHKNVQMVFQNPFAALNPRMTVQKLLAEPLGVHGLPKKQRMGRVEELIDLVGLNGRHLTRYPHELSGGQCQRVGIARALSLDPKVVVFDEPVASLDVSIQAQMLKLLHEIQRREELAFVFISHDLSVVRIISDNIMVLYLGKVVEVGPMDEVYDRPRHPYTQALMSAIPVPTVRGVKKRERIVLEGEVPSPFNPPSGCPFRTRCWKAQDICAVEEPTLLAGAGTHPVACHFPD